jgi:hypothetical protein
LISRITDHHPHEGNHLTKDHLPVGYRFGVLAAFAGISCFFSLTQMSCLFLGTMGVTMSHPLAVSILVISFLLALLFASRFREPAVAVGKSQKPDAWVSRTLTTLFNTIASLVLVWAGWIWLQLWMLAALRPLHDWDGLYYHVPAIHEWVIAGGVSWIDRVPDVPYINYPMGVEVFSFLMHYVFRTSDLLDACNLWYWPLAFFSLVVIATKLGARGIWRWLAGSLIVGAPVFVSQSVSSYIDIGFSSAVMASIAASCVFIFHDDRSVWWKALLLGANIGLMMGSKGTGLPFAFVFLAVLIAGVIWVRGFDRLKVYLRRLSVSGLVALLVGGFWYTRNVIETGNPIHPLQLKVGEKVLIDGWDYAQFTDANMPQWLAEYPPGARMFISWLQLDAPISGCAPIGGMGYVWIAGALPAFLYLCVLLFRKRRQSAYPVREFFFLTALVLMLLVIQPATWWARFTIWLHALGLPCIAVVLCQAVSRWHSARRHLFTIILGFGIIAGAIRESDTTSKIEWQDGRDPQAERYRDMFLPSIDYVFPQMANIPAVSRLLESTRVARSPMANMSSLFVGILCTPLGKREIVVVPAEPRESDVAALREAGIEWVVWDVSDMGDVPEVLRRAAKETQAYEPSPDLRLHMLRI